MGVSTHQKTMELGASKSSTSFISNLISKPIHAFATNKGTIHLSKILKPSASSFKKYINEKTGENRAGKSPNITCQEKNIENNSSFFTKYEKEIGLEDILEIVENSRLDPLMPVKKKYKEKKQEILKKAEEDKEKVQKEIEKMQKRNLKLADCLMELEELETREVSMIMHDSPNPFNEIANKLIETRGQLVVNHEISSAIAQELSSFKINKNFSSILRLNKEITEFFSTDELNVFYEDISTALCQKAMIEINQVRKALKERLKVKDNYRLASMKLKKSINIHLND